MIRMIDDFIQAYGHESETTLKCLKALTDESLKRSVADGHRTLGHIAWHIVMTVPEMMGRTGLLLGAVSHEAPPPDSADAIVDAYVDVCEKLLAAITSKWDDATLEVEDDMYGMQWARGQTLAALIGHEVHHRGQMTVLMRQAGLIVPGVYGPAKEDWAQMGMEAPPF